MTAPKTESERQAQIERLKRFSAEKLAQEIEASIPDVEAVPIRKGLVDHMRELDEKIRSERGGAA